MSFEHKPNSGSFFKNNKKENDKHSDFNGTYKDENGVEYWVNVWEKKSDKGTFYSFTMKRK
jgi:hypothetical protein